MSQHQGFPCRSSVSVLNLSLRTYCVREAESASNDRWIATSRGGPAIPQRLLAMPCSSCGGTVFLPPSMSWMLQLAPASSHGGSVSYCKVPRSCC